jgi:hypothetical protein
MGRKFLIILCCVFAISAFASGFGPGVGVDGALSSSGGDGSGAYGGGGGFVTAGGGSNTGAIGSRQSILGQLESQGLHFYLGGGLALGLYHGTMMATEGYPSGAAPLLPPAGHKAKPKGKLPGFALQVGAQRKGKVLTDVGVMLMYNPMTVTQKTSGGGGAFTNKNTIQQKYNFSVYGGVGVPLTPVVNVFGKLGLIYSNFAIGYQQVGSTYSGSTNAGGFGMAPGVMVQYKMSDTFSANLDLSYAIYQSITTENMAKAPTGYDYKVKTAPKVLTIMVGGTMALGSGK